MLCSESMNLNYHPMQETMETGNIGDASSLK